jgi:hypothetical protein
MRLRRKKSRLERGCSWTWESSGWYEYKTRICLSKVLFQFRPKLQNVHSEKKKYLFWIWEPYRGDYVKRCYLGCNICRLLLGGFWFVLLFGLGNIGITFLRNVSEPVPDYTVLFLCLVQDRNVSVWKQVFHRRSIRKNRNTRSGWKIKLPVRNFKVCVLSLRFYCHWLKQGEERQICSCRYC